MSQRIALIEEIINQHGQALDEKAMITIQNGRVRTSRAPVPSTIDEES